MDFITILNQILVLFLLIIVGFVITKLGIMTQELTKGLSTLLIKVTLPALIISSMMIPFTKERLNQSMMILGISIGVYLLSMTFAWIIGKLYRNNPNAGIFQFFLVFSNVGFMGYPVVQVVFGKEAVFYASIYNLPFNLLLFTLGVYYLSKHNKETENGFDWSIFLSPAVISVFIGFFIFLFSIPIPSFIGKSIDLVGSTTTPLSMLIVGSLLTKVPFKSLLTDKHQYVMSFLRLLVLPLLVFSLLKLGIKDPLLLGVPVLITAMPIASNAAILSEEYGSNAEVASQGVFISTLLSILTIPLLALLLFS